MGICASIGGGGPLPFNSIESPVLQIYTKNRKKVNYITVALYPKGYLYLAHWEEGDDLPIRQDKILAIEAVENGVVCILETGKTATFKRVVDGYILHEEANNKTLYDEIGSDLFPTTRNADFNKLRVLFPGQRKCGGRAGGGA